MSMKRRSCGHSHVPIGELHRLDFDLFAKSRGLRGHDEFQPTTGEFSWHSNGRSCSPELGTGLKERNQPAVRMKCHCDYPWHRQQQSKIIFQGQGNRRSRSWWLSDLVKVHVKVVVINTNSPWSQATAKRWPITRFHNRYENDSSNERGF